MKIFKLIPMLVVASAILSGCYTQFYRPGMEMSGRGPYDTLYNRYDSTAIDTSLTKPEYADQYPPQESGYDQWNYWGRPRTRWGFDFYNYDPSYYHSYYGYYDYYSVPWWQNYGYNPGWWYGPWQPGTPGEPDQPRDRGRRDYGAGGGVISTPPGGAVTTPPPTPPGAPTPPKKEEKKDDTNKRDGRRGR